MKPDVYDWLVMAGLILVGYGLYLLQGLPTSLVMVGAALAGIGVFGAWRKGRI